MIEAIYEHLQQSARSLGVDLPPLAEDDLSQTPLGQALARIVQAADGGELSDTLADDIRLVCETIFASPVEYAEIPRSFWESPLGKVVARARLRLCPDLITIGEAARLCGVSVQAISAAVQTGRLPGYYNPDAPKRQGRVLVSKAAVLSGR